MILGLHLLPDTVFGGSESDELISKTGEDNIENGLLLSSKFVDPSPTEFELTNF